MKKHNIAGSPPAEPEPDVSCQAMEQKSFGKPPLDLLADDTVKRREPVYKIPTGTGEKSRLKIPTDWDFGKRSNMEQMNRAAEESREAETSFAAGGVAATGKVGNSGFTDDGASYGSNGEPAGSGTNAFATPDGAIGKDDRDAVNDGSFSDTDIDENPDRHKTEHGTGKKLSSGETGEHTGSGKAAVMSDAERARNAENARRRREAQTKAQLEEARREAIIEALGGKNPYTGEAMSDAQDVAEFLRMQRMAKEGKDPVADYAREIKAESKKKADEERAKAESERWYREDRENFESAHPDVDLNALVNDPMFADYAAGKVGKQPLSDIYTGFLRMTGTFEKKAQERAAQILANKSATPGALAGISAGDAGFFTREQVKEMSRADVHQNYEKIVESMKKWK